jgi:hypothetical protein
MKNKMQQLPFSFNVSSSLQQLISWAAFFSLPLSRQQVISSL